MTQERGLNGAVVLQDDARDYLVRMAGGDARRALTVLEAAAGVALDKAREAGRAGRAPSRSRRRTPRRRWTTTSSATTRTATSTTT